MTLSEIFSILWTFILTGAMIYSRFFGKTLLGDETLLTLDTRYEEQTRLAIQTAQTKEREYWQRKLQDSEDENSQKIKDLKEDHQQSLEAIEAKAAVLQEKVFSLVTKVNGYLEAMVTLERLNSENQIKIIRLENNAKRNKDALEAARDVASESDKALLREKEERKASEQRLSARIDALQSELQAARKEVSDAELEKAKLRGMIEYAQYQQQKEKEDRKKSTEELKQNEKP